ncbi:MAG: response regulator, partial [Desulfobacterales bacterium]|nr:response regulator [Desulfobacterales bacterium]
DVVASLAPHETTPVTILDSLPTIVYDKLQLRQLFQNLIGNAIEHMGKPEGRVEVSCRNQGSAWEFCVRDNGEGIEERHFERIFKIFQSLKPRAGAGAAGVGLSLVKKIAERNGGAVRVESTVGEGSAFYFTAPKKPVPGKREMGRKWGRSDTVLIIDDSQGFSEVAATMLRREGREVLCAGGGKEAREILKSHEGAIDLVLMDIYIPNENPIERYDMLRSLRPEMKIIVCTGGGTSETVEALENRGADGVLMKPFRKEDLKEILGA